MSEAARAEKLRSSFEAAPRERLWPNQRPRDAATLIVVDRQGSAPRVLMGRRHPGLKFMPGLFVFPGGRLERADGLMRAAGELAPVVAERLGSRAVGRSAGRGRALVLTAIRETYEETGILIGRADQEVAGPVGANWQAFADRRVLPDLGAVSFVARAITPPRRPKRFDTRFFAVDRSSVAGETDGFVGPDKELTELAWVDLAEAKALELPRITAIMLEELEHRIGRGFDPALPVPFYRELRGRFTRVEL